MIKTLAIIGLGVVGSAVYNSFNNYLGTSNVDIFDESTKLYDNDSKIWENDYSAIMICVDSPMLSDGSQSSKTVDMILKDLLDRSFTGTVIIKSTILFSRIAEYTNILNIVMWPEFLNARTSNEDFKNQQYHVLGGNILNTKIVEEFIIKNFEFNFQEEGLIFEHCTIKEAIDFKYTRNIKQAYNVMFWEMIQDLSGNSRKMSQMLSNIPVQENSNISQDGYRGYGQSLTKSADDFSACLDKDICAVLKEGKGHILLQALNDYNEGLA